MKEIKFTPENLERHLNHPKYKDELYGKTIITTRDEPKGNIGDIVLIKGVGIFCITSIIKCEVNREMLYFYEEEGFKTIFEYEDEIKKIYGKDIETAFVHRLLKLNEEVAA